MSESRTPQPVEVVLVRAGPGGRVAVQEWRSRTTGRVHEVPEAQCFAPAGILEEGSAGWLVYAGGVPWVGETKQEAQRMARRAAEARPPRGGVARTDRTEPRSLPWPWVFAMLLLVAIAWAMLL